MEIRFLNNMQDQFKKLSEKYPSLSSIMVFVKMIRNKRVTDFELRKNFDDLVDSKDYQGTPKEQIIRWIKEEIIK